MLRAFAEAAGPRTLRCLVGTRPRSPRRGEGVGGDLLRTLGVDPDDSRSMVDLRRQAYVDRAAITRYVDRLLAGEGEQETPTSASLSHDERTRLAESIAEKAGDNFLVALLTGLAVRDAPEQDIAYPESVGEAFELYLNNFGERRPRVEALLRALAYEESEGLAATDRAWVLIAQALGEGAFPASGSESEIEEAIAAEIDRFVQADAAYLIQVGLREGRKRGRVEQVPLYRLYHQAIVDHLRADRHEEFQRRIFEQLYDGVPGDGDRLDWETADPYVLRYLVRHALASEEASALNALLADPSFCIHADPATFEPRFVLRAESVEALAAAHAIGRSINPLRLIPAPCERAAQLALSAKQAGYLELAAAFDRELTNCHEGPAPDASNQNPLRWRCLWARSNPESPHFALRGHQGWVGSVAVGTLAGEHAIVSGGGTGRSAYGQRTDRNTASR